MSTPYCGAPCTSSRGKLAPIPLGGPRPNRTTLVASATLGVLCGALGCSGGDATVVDETVGRLSLLTFNAALGVGLAPYPEQRREALEARLQSEEADVVCLQEVWQYSDVERLRGSMAREYPYSLSSVEPVADAQVLTCSEAEAESLLQCLTTSCADLDTQELTLCAVANCADAFAEVSLPCRECVVANQQLQPETIATTCASGDASAAFEEQNGLLLLSRYPLRATEFLPLASALGDRGILAARVGAYLLGSVDVLCTHLTPDFRGISYTGAFGSWAGERDHHIGELLRLADDFDFGGLVALLGDMNTGPATPSAVGEGARSFARFAQAGYAAPYAEQEGAECTFCGSNPLVGEAEETQRGVIIDHVLLRGAPESVVVTSERTLDEPLAIEVDGETVDTAYSDHYAVEVVLTESP